MQIGMMTELTFLRQNQGWNAEPNAPALKIDVAGETLTLSFYLNPLAYDADENKIAHLDFNHAAVGAGTSQMTTPGLQEQGGSAGKLPIGASSTR